jgi:hypothetical protein
MKNTPKILYSYGKIIVITLFLVSVYLKSTATKHKLLKFLIFFKDWFHIFTLLEDDFSCNLPAEISLINSQFNFLNSMTRYKEKQGIYLWFKGVFNILFVEDFNYFSKFLSKLSN